MPENNNLKRPKSKVWILVESRPNFKSCSKIKGIFYELFLEGTSNRGDSDSFNADIQSVFTILQRQFGPLFIPPSLQLDALRVRSTHNPAFAGARRRR